MHPSTRVSSHYSAEDSAHITQSILVHLVATLLLVCVCLACSLTVKIISEIKATLFFLTVNVVI